MLLRISFHPFSIPCWTFAALLSTGAHTHITFEVALNNNEIWDALEAHLADEVTGLNSSRWCSGWRRTGVPPNGADRRWTVDMRWLLTTPTASLNDAAHFLLLHVCHDTSNNTSFTSFFVVIGMQKVLFIAGILALERTTSLLAGSRISWH